MMGSRRVILCTTVTVCLNVSCGKKDSDDWDYALPPGTYDVTGPLCVSTDAKPAYKDIARRINLLDFDHVTTHTLTFEGFHTKRVISDPDCKLTVEQPVGTNRDGSFAHKIAKRFTFEPENCTFSVSAGTRSFEAGRQSSGAFQDSEDESMDIPFDIRPEETAPDTLLIISSDNETLNAVWGDYGCSVPDRVKWTVTRKPEA